MSYMQERAKELGIATEFTDAVSNQGTYYVDDDILEFFVDRIHDQKALRWQSPLDAIYVCTLDNLVIDVVAKTDNIVIKDFQFKNFGIIETNKDYNKYKLEILTPMAIGYHSIKVEVDGKIFETTLAVAPHRCYENKDFEDKKMWGFAIQLYALRSKTNWGIGDFSDLNKLVDLAAKSGADIIGINPINVLWHNNPEDASPYSSISRLFINPIYIDVEAVSGFDRADIKGVDIEALRKLDIIDYTNVYNLKIKVLEKIYERSLLKTNQEFEDFCNLKGADLDNLATFQTLNEKYKWAWKKWSFEYRNPNNKEVIEFKKQNAKRIGFFKFLQFWADKQFKAVAKNIEAKKLQIGLYRDLAVGVGQCSAEVWGNPDAFIKDAGAGAPPDMFNPKGQDWGLGAFNPYTLKQCKYMPMINVLRANMAYAGALRLDHVMWLLRLFMIPNKEERGTYIYYNFDDMLNILAIESVLNRCTIVGESIGNVPAGFLEKLKEKNIHPISVLWAEKYDFGKGGFKNPQDYPDNAFVSISTHDMAPLKMWWFGYDIALSRKLGLIDNDEKMNGAYKSRETDRWKLLQVLDNNNLWPADNKRFADYLYGEDYPEGVEEAVNHLVSKSSAKVFLACLEDVLHVDKLQNLPGTDRDKYPNWRRKLPYDIEDLEKNPLYVRNIKIIKTER